MNRFADVIRRKFLTRRNVRTLCFMAGAAVLAAMIAAGDPVALWRNAVALRWCLPAVVAVWGAGYVLNALAWNTIIRSNALAVPLPFGRLFRFTVTGFAINYITPFGLLGGEPYRIVELKPYLGVERSTGAVILYMMMHVCSHFFFWILSCGLVAWSVGVRSAFGGGALAAVAVACGALIFWFFRGYRAGLAVRLAEMLGRWPLVGRRLARLSPEKRERLRLVDDNIGSLLSCHPRAFWASMGLEFVSRLVNCCEIWIIFYLLGVPAGYVPAVIVVALSSLLANVLFFSPLQLGTREGGLLLAMQVILPSMSMGELLPLAVSVSLMTRVREFFWIAAGLVFLRFRNPAAVPQRGAAGVVTVEK